MSYQNWACFGWMLPATRENLKVLGITDEQIKSNLGEPERGENIEDWWSDTLLEAGYDNIQFVGKIGRKSFTVYVMHISGDDDLDPDMDANVDTYFEFEFDELYKPTSLHGLLTKVGMKHCTRVSGG